MRLAFISSVKIGFVHITHTIWFLSLSLSLSVCLVVSPHFAVCFVHIFALIELADRAYVTMEMVSAPIHHMHIYNHVHIGYLCLWRALCDTISLGVCVCAHMNLPPHSLSFQSLFAIPHWWDPIAWSSFISPHTQINYTALNSRCAFAHVCVRALDQCTRVYEKQCDWTTRTSSIELICFSFHYQFWFR